MTRAGLWTFATAIGIVVLSLGACSGAEQLTCGGETSDRELRRAPELVKSGELIGLTEDDLRERFGEPSSRKIGGDLSYWLSPDDGLFCIDSKWLTFDFDADGRVARARITQD
ncbi:MAG: hypothetical protein AB7N24_00210 [Dehalococcoidia bacterium]